MYGTWPDPAPCWGDKKGGFYCRELSWAWLVREYVARCEEQGITPIVYTEILASCAVCGGMGEHSKIQTARPHRHRYCGERCYKACTQSKLELPTVNAWAS